MKAFNHFSMQKKKMKKAVAVQNHLKTSAFENNCKGLILQHITNIIRYFLSSSFYKNTTKRTYCQTSLRK